MYRSAFQLPNPLISFIISLIFIFFILSPFAIASDEPFTYPSNWGGTGLLEIPTARVMRENTYRLGISQVKPYRYFYGTFSPLKGLEIDGRITEILGVKVGGSLWQGYGNYKDKAIDLKYRFIPEGKYMPAVSLGIMDPHGTRVYPSQYIVLSKQIYPFDFTIGLGNGRFGRRPLPSRGEGAKVELIGDPKSWLRDALPFWGIQFAPSKRYALMLEYSPIRYHKQTRDPARNKYFSNPVPLKYNFGFRYKPTRWTEVDISYQRGNRLGINLSMNFDIGRPLVPIYDHPYIEEAKYKSKPLIDRLTEALNYSGFSDIAVYGAEGELWIWVQNDRYYYDTRAVGVILGVINNIVPENTGAIHIILRDNGIPRLQITTTKADIKSLFSDKLSLDEFLYLSGVSTAISKAPSMRGRHRRLIRYGIKPSFETFLNDPSGFFKYRLGLAGWVQYHPWQGATLLTALESYPVNNVSTVNKPLSIPARSDLPLYMKESLSLGRLMFDQVFKMPHQVYGRLSGGLLEIEYGGIDGELAVPLLDGRLFLGVGGSIVKKRETNRMFKFKNDDAKDLYSTAFLNTRINIPEIDASVDLKTGRFLAGDFGTRVTLSKFINGVILFAWYGVTDTSVFTDSINRGYRDKGIGITIPLRLFKGSDTKTVYSYALSPWTRDVAQDIDHYNPLFDFIGRDTKILLDRDRGEMYK